jgi:hypothetical protein
VTIQTKTTARHSLLKTGDIQFGERRNRTQHCSNRSHEFEPEKNSKADLSI